MEPEILWAYVESERRTLADLLAGLTAAQWEHPSLCTEWQVRDVAAHVAMTPAGDPSTWGIVSGLARARGHLWNFGRDVAIAWAQRPIEEIVGVLRDDAASRKRPIVTTDENVLLDIVVHGQDIAVPLGIDRPVPTEAGLAAFGRAWAMGWPFYARKRYAGLTLAATDADLEVGDGPRVEGRLADLLLLVSARTDAARERLSGPGVQLVKSPG